MTWSLLIRNGTVVDGSGAPARAADVAVEGDRIAAVGPGLAGEAERVIDAKGLMVAPGFIDIHSHSDLVYDKCPSAESKVRQGVTTEVVGMCSFSPAPVAPGRAHLVQEWAGGIGGKIPITWNTFGEYLDHLRGAGPVGEHRAVRGPRGPAAGRGRAPPGVAVTPRRSRRAWSACSRKPSTPAPSASPPGWCTRRASTATRTSWSGSPAAWRAGAGSTSRTSGARRPRSSRRPRKPSRSASGAACPVQIAHVKASGRENWGKMDRVLRMIDSARARGVDVTGDVYPYPAGSTKMDNLLPAWMHDGGISKLLDRLTDPKARQRAIGDCLVDGERWRTGSGGMGWDEIMIATCSKPELAGIHIAELARRTGKEPAQAMMDLVMEERAGVSMVVFSQSEENVGTALGYAHNMVGSDSLSLHAGPGPHPGKPHPRSYGTFPRVLGVYCREKRLFSWETAVHKMTGMPATKLGLKDRGLVQGGRAADLALFDPATVRDVATFPDPHRHPVGIPYVIVNGRVVVDGARYHAVPAGRVLTPQ